MTVDDRPPFGYDCPTCAHIPASITIPAPPLSFFRRFDVARNAPNPLPGRRSDPRTGMNRRSPPNRRPGKLRLSPTRLRLYLFCPKAYQYYYVRGLRWGEISPASSFGGSLHRALQAFHEAGALAPPSV